jgi:hypothetical protein
VVARRSLLLDKGAVIRGGDMVVTWWCMSFRREWLLLILNISVVLSGRGQSSPAKGAHPVLPYGGNSRKNFGFKEIGFRRVQSTCCHGCVDRTTIHARSKNKKINTHSHSAAKILPVPATLSNGFETFTTQATAAHLIDLCTFLSYRASPYPPEILGPRDLSSTVLLYCLFLARRNLAGYAGNLPFLRTELEPDLCVSFKERLFRPTLWNA